ncbi:MAG: hypothetical protein AABZ47_10155 [Planctomycetota bacterium]
MHESKRGIMAFVLMLSAVVGCTGRVCAAEPSTGYVASAQPTNPTTDQPAGALHLTSFEEPPASDQANSTVTEKRASPFSISATYSLYSDYILRGINLSEYRGEGREKPNHQMTTSITTDVGLLFGEDAGSWGSFGFVTFFEWFAAQRKIDPVGGGQNLQEVDYSMSWSYPLTPISSTFTLGYTFLTFPNRTQANTHEWYVKLAHNDTWMWKWLWPDNDGPVLSPWVFLSHDVDSAAGGSWIETGVKHDFAVVENVTVSPAMTLAIDHRYLDRLLATGSRGSTRLAYLQYALSVGYNLSSALNWSDKYGTVVLSGFLNFNDALGNTDDDGTISDEFYGGISLGWSF